MKRQGGISYGEVDNVAIELDVIGHTSLYSHIQHPLYTVRTFCDDFYLCCFMFIVLLINTKIICARPHNSFLVDCALFFKIKQHALS